MKATDILHILDQLSWDSVYDREVKNFKEIGDQGEAW